MLLIHGHCKVGGSQQHACIPLALHTVMSRIKAGRIPVEADVRPRLPFTSGFYSNQVFLCVSTLKPG